MQKKRRSITPEQYQLQNVKDIINLEKRDRIAMNMSDRIASTITAFSGSMLYVVLHVIWFILWILINTGSIGVRPFDPFPFNLLTMTVSLEAIFLSAFVLISQNKQAIQADRRAKIDLQVNTKLIAMVAEIQQHLKIHKREDAEIKALKQTTNITHLANAIDKAEENLEGKKPKGPASAADTSK
jgi:uncharacterized membrane protein